jgi:hypothetical protein
LNEQVIPNVLLGNRTIGLLLKEPWLLVEVEIGGKVRTEERNNTHEDD